ncbi:hypothetical protein [Methylobacterium sp. 22177]|uniref:hypothetical protein n=1 Tax=Methylobacterium sp. 22177 TaxID=3453885 RepID=UPI003F846E67
MSSFLLLNNLDVGRAFAFDPLNRKPEQIADWLLTEYVKKRGGSFNYDPAIKCLYEMFQGRLSLADAKMRCLTTGQPVGRPYNVQAIDCVGPYAVANPSTCYRIGYTAVPVGRAHGRTVYIGLKAPLLRVASGAASVVLPGFRKTSRPVGPQVDVACSIALATFARDDFSEADFEYLDAGEAAEGRRFLRVYSGRERQIYGVDDVDALLDVYVKGVALALESGVTVKDANLRGYRVIDPDQPSMFG